MICGVENLIMWAVCDDGANDDDGDPDRMAVLQRAEPTMTSGRQVRRCGVKVVGG